MLFIGEKYFTVFELCKSRIRFRIFSRHIRALADAYYAYNVSQIGVDRFLETIFGKKHCRHLISFWGKNNEFVSIVEFLVVAREED